MELITLIALGIVYWSVRRTFASPAPEAPSRRSSTSTPLSTHTTTSTSAPNLFNYTSRAGDRFTFDIQPHGREMRAYIIDQPSYGNRPSDGHSTHRYGIDEGRPYVCVAEEHTPTNDRHAKDWAAYWAEGTSRYIRSGNPFS